MNCASELRSFKIIYLQKSPTNHQFHKKSKFKALFYILEGQGPGASSFNHYLTQDSFLIFSNATMQASVNLNNILLIIVMIIVTGMC